MRDTGCPSTGSSTWRAGASCAIASLPRRDTLVPPSSRQGMSSLRKRSPISRWPSAKSSVSADRRDPHRNRRKAASYNLARLIEGQPGTARVQEFGGTHPQGANEIRLDRGAAEERGIDLGVVEPGHGSAIEAERSGSQDEVGALQRGVAHHDHSADGGVFEPFPGLRAMRKQKRNLFVE